MEAKAHYKNVVNLMCKAGQAIGLNIYLVGWKFNFNYLLFIVDIIVFIIVGTFTLIRVWGNLVEVCLTLVTCSFCIQGIYGAAFFIRLAPLAQKVLKNTENLFQIYSSQNEKGQCLLRYIKLIEKIVKSIIYSFCGISLFLVVGYFIVAVATKRTILFWEYTLPYLDAHHHPGYEINWIYQVIRLTLITGGLLSYQTMLALFFGLGCCQIDILMIELKELNALINTLTLNGKAQNIEIKTMIVQQKAEQKLKVQKIFELHQKILEYFKDCNTLLNGFMLLSFLCFGFQAVLSLYLGIKVLYIPGFLTTIIDLLCVLEICVVGTIVESKVSLFFFYKFFCD